MVEHVVDRVGGHVHAGAERERDAGYEEKESQPRGGMPRVKVERDRSVEGEERERPEKLDQVPGRHTARSKWNFDVGAPEVNERAQDAEPSEPRRKRCGPHGVGRQGAMISWVQPDSVRRNRMRWWRRFSRPSQNSIVSGTMRNPDQKGGRGTFVAGSDRSSSAKRRSIPARPSGRGWLCGGRPPHHLMTARPRRPVRVRLLGTDRLRASLDAYLLP
jgi:hypothetical protein